PWQSLVSSYEEDIEESHPEPPNIQEIILSREGIVVHQYNIKFDRAAAAELDEPIMGYQLEFPLEAMKQIVCEERSVPSWVETAKPGAQRILNSIRFKLVERPKGKDDSRSPAPAKVAVDKDTAVPMETDSGSEEFSLAKLDWQSGMEIRLTFEGTLPTNTNSPRSVYCWLWPMIVHFLAGSGYNTKDKKQNNLGLDAWAGANKDKIREFSLEANDFYGGCSWRVLPKPRREAQAQPTRTMATEASSRPVITPQPRIPAERGWVDDMERPGELDAKTPEEKKAQTGRFLDGFQKAVKRRKALDEEISKLQSKASKARKNEQEWQDAYLGSLRDGDDRVEEDERLERRVVK
ncbi:MAG: hypothetical protein Q9226_009026, partial [Calogaya cf. arnoldii]